jgi:NADH-quinone oxidoreductase subunit J
MVVGLLLLTVLVTSTTMMAIRGPEQGGWLGLAPEPPEIDPATSLSSTRLGEAFLGFREITPKTTVTGLPHNAGAIGRKRMAYLLPFEIVSVHLLVVLIGAAYLARAKRRRATVV